MKLIPIQDFELFIRYHPCRPPNFYKGRMIFNWPRKWKFEGKIFFRKKIFFFCFFSSKSDRKSNLYPHGIWFTSSKNIIPFFQKVIFRIYNPFILGGWYSREDTASLFSKLDEFQLKIFWNTARSYGFHPLSIKFLEKSVKNRRKKTLWNLKISKRYDENQKAWASQNLQSERKRFNLFLISSENHSFIRSSQNQIQSIFWKFTLNRVGKFRHIFDHFPALCEGIFSGQLGLFKGYRRVPFLRKMTLWWFLS